MSWLHRHKWEYLAKEYHVKINRKFHHMSYMGSSSEDEEINITTIRFFCRGCAKFKSETVEGRVKSTEIMQIGLLGKSDE